MDALLIENGFVLIICAVCRAYLGLEEEIRVLGVDGVAQVFETVDLFDSIFADLEFADLIVAPAQ